MGSHVAGKTHALCVPFPAQGHIKPMMQLARLLHSKGFYITFVNSEFIQDRITEANGQVAATGFDDFLLETIPDGLPSCHGRTTNVIELCESTRKNMKAPFRELMTRLKCSLGVPGVTCVISDGLMNFTQEVAEEFGVPRVTFWTTSACGYWAYLQIPELIERGYAPLKGMKIAVLDFSGNLIPGTERWRWKTLTREVRDALEGLETRVFRGCVQYCSP
ncbi:hypothetical protein AMTR_s00064p00191380 [Amborella trichopoda]|uniref:Glycosyltransferase N-terminal domain-containing protein n=1 Tax=Amborella trichopoda TaxID=13333 RepID=U5DC70_AMBTC|nr:hypothetical protein AMTR_s00064p00191380 [Amborella trichopoda]